MFDTWNFNTFNALDKNFNVRVDNNIGLILSYSVNKFEAAIFIFYQSGSRPGIHIFYLYEIENDCTDIKSAVATNSNCIVELHSQNQMNLAF